MSVDRDNGTAGVSADATVTETTVWQLDPTVQAAQKRIVPRLILAQILGSVGIGTAGSVGALLASR